MGKREKGGISPGVIFVSSLGGILLFIIIALCVSFLFMYNIIPFDLIGYMSKAIMFAISLVVATNIKKRVRGDEFVNCVLGSMLYFALVIMLSTANKNGEINAAGVTVCLLLCVLGCFLLFLRKDKSSKMHKNRHKH